MTESSENGSIIVFRLNFELNVRRLSFVTRFVIRLVRARAVTGSVSDYVLFRSCKLSICAVIYFASLLWIILFVETHVVDNFGTTCSPAWITSEECYWIINWDRHRYWLVDFTRSLDDV